LCSTYPGHSTAAPCAELRIGIAKGILVEVNIVSTMAEPAGIVKGTAAGEAPHRLRIALRPRGRARLVEMDGAKPKGERK
jgi:hypothetical protein